MRSFTVDGRVRMVVVEAIAVWAFWIIVAVLVLFLVWAGRRLSNRTGGEEATGDRHRRTGGYSPGA